VVEDVVGFGAELDLKVVDWRVELLVHVEVGFIEGWCASGIARGIAERAENIACSVLEGRQDEGVVVDVVVVAGVGCAVGTSLGYFLAGDDVGAVLVGAAVGSGDLRRDLLCAVGRVGQVEGCAGLGGVDGADLPAAEDCVFSAVDAGEVMPAVSDGDLINEAGDVIDGQVVV